jgi:hypothetical protein
MANKAKHAFGMLEKIDEALSAGKIDAYDILFVKDENGKPYVGWIDKNGNKVICDSTEEVDAKIAAAMNEHLTKKYEVTDVPAGTLVNISENEIRICCPADSKWVKQSVGEGGDANTYYFTLKTYAPDDATGYIEHLGNQVDEAILTDLKTDAYNKKYQPTWLGLAKYDESADAWTYFGANSTKDKMTGWDYRIDWFNADGVMIASDSIRINLSNEDCHYTIEPYYVNNVKSYVDTQIEEKISEVNTSYEVIEF